ncbi:MAG: DUF86 domain-containing protein, partial [Actinobacteria bacterium]|nr:DUF86 domain-containing protein [Actinomycetota bacterium]
ISQCRAVCGSGWVAAYLCDAFRMLAGARLIPGDLVQRLGRAAGFRNLVVHTYAELDLRRVHTRPTTRSPTRHRHNCSLEICAACREVPVLPIRGERPSAPDRRSSS